MTPRTGRGTIAFHARRERDLDADLKGLSPEAIATLAARMLGQLREQRQHLQQRDERIAQQAQMPQRAIERKDAELRFKTAKLEKVTFELARLKAWKFGAKTEAMSAEQRRLFEETLAEDEAEPAGAAASSCKASRRRRKAQPTTSAASPSARHCPSTCVASSTATSPRTPRARRPTAARQMVRVGEDVSERLDIVPAEFFVHRHIRGKWACKCCQLLVQEPVRGADHRRRLPASGLLAHTLVSRFVDHLPYYRQEQINARSGVHTPRSTLADWSGRAGARAEAAVRRAQALRARQRACCTPTRRRWRCSTPARARPRRPTSGPTRAARSMPTPGVVYDFCLGRGRAVPDRVPGPTARR